MNFRWIIRLEKIFRNMEHKYYEGRIPSHNHQSRIILRDESSMQ